MSISQKKQALFEEIKNADCNYLGFGKYPAFGQIVLAGFFGGLPYDFDHAVGYIVQIRKGRGQYHSAQYLMRCADGSLTNHENQSFYIVPDDLAAKVLMFFNSFPDNEKEDVAYTIGNEYPEVGYIIEHKNGDPVGDSPAFGIVITKG
ncbi:hypothetical protein C9J21_18325 [Photobacterium phosphoreum]|uniref:hypothetical protein n=1 Tax=Photobacterium phosphoreum TaxID=659 RepID=UPI000D171F52|nr:hypothetical protein [Photobacterium phosphoreum]PSW30844.1 hypothetical protein C9J21_18325 [Photobacterium phosphoreum]